MIPDAPGSDAALREVPGAEPAERAAALERALEALSQLAGDSSVPRNIRRGAQSAYDSVARSRAALDVRIASAVSVLDELANAPNLPSHGRTALWSILSSLESLP
ncbi:MAG: UPF0147 family protein [Thermoplasmata archaeon]